MRTKYKQQSPMTPSAVPGSPLSRVRERGGPSLANPKPPTGTVSPAFSCLLLRIPVNSSESPWAPEWGRCAVAPWVGCPTPQSCCGGTCGPCQPPPPDGGGCVAPRRDATLRPQVLSSHLSHQYSASIVRQVRGAPLAAEPLAPSATALYDCSHFLPLTGMARATAASPIRDTCCTPAPSPRATVTGPQHLILQLRPACQRSRLDRTRRLKPGSPAGPLGPCPSPVSSPGKRFLSTRKRPPHSTRGACLSEDRGGS